MTASAMHRQGFSSLRAGGFNWDALPLRLFDKGNRKFWNPRDLDFSQDAQDWRELSDNDKDNALMLCAQFIAGEEAVTRTCSPSCRRWRPRAGSATSCT